ncbi:unnamed protein product [Caretta caretta]
MTGTNQLPSWIHTQSSDLSNGPTPFSLGSSHFCSCLFHSEPIRLDEFWPRVHWAKGKSLFCCLVADFGPSLKRLKAQDHTKIPLQALRNFHSSSYGPAGASAC